MSELEVQLKKAQESHNWFAPSMFITSYGKRGFKIEVSAYKHNPDGSIETDDFNIDGSNYAKTKKAFWQAWNSKHHNATLSILKSVSSYGL
jgi:hypothetical protein